MGYKEGLLEGGVSNKSQMTGNGTTGAVRDKNRDTKELSLWEGERRGHWSYPTAKRGMSKSGRDDSKPRGQISKGRVLGILTNSMGSPGTLYQGRSYTSGNHLN